MFGFKLVRKSKHLEEMQMLESFKRVTVCIDQECSQFANFVMKELDFNNGSVLMELDKHVSMMNSLIILYGENKLRSPLYDINLNMELHEMNDNAKVIRNMIHHVNGLIEEAKRSIHQLQEREDGDEFIEKLQGDLSAFIDSASNDINKVQQNLLLNLTTIHLSVIHDILRIAVGVDLLMEYHDSLKRKVPKSRTKIYEIRIGNKYVIKKKG